MQRIIQLMTPQLEVINKDLKVDQWETKEDQILWEADLLMLRNSLSRIQDNK